MGYQVSTYIAESLASLEAALNAQLGLTTNQHAIPSATIDRALPGLSGLQGLRNEAHSSAFFRFNNDIPAHFNTDQSLPLRFFRFYERHPHTVERYCDEPGLRLLISQINSFWLSLAKHLRRPTYDLSSGGQLDPDQLAAVMLLHGSMVVLAEPLVSTATWGHELAKLGMAAARAVLSLVDDSMLARSIQDGS